VIPDEQSYCIQFGEPNKYYKDDGFPFCFDNQVRLSARLLRKSLELMGFVVHEVPNCEGGMPDRFYNLHKAFLGICSPNEIEDRKGLPPDPLHLRTLTQIHSKQDLERKIKMMALFGASSRAYQICIVISHAIGAIAGAQQAKTALA
jgi:hypothetical protein